jgi:hypothetical protein
MNFSAIVRTLSFLARYSLQQKLAMVFAGGPRHRPDLDHGVLRQQSQLSGPAIPTSTRQKHKAS